MDEELSREKIEARLTTRFIGRCLELHREIDSTNSRAVTLALEGAPEGTLVLAEHQTRGKGRQGRRWLAPPGSSLLMSLILRPSIEPRQAQWATMVCSLAAVEAIAQVCGLTVGVKWPNDLVVSGKKLGGVLTELGLRGERLDYVAVGLGLNVNLDLSTLPEVMSPPTSLLSELGHPVSRLELLVALLERIETRYQAMSAGWSPLSDWCEHLATLGQRVRVSSSTEPVIEGVAEGVDEDGALLVRSPEGCLHIVHAGDVTLRGHS